MGATKLVGIFLVQVSQGIGWVGNFRLILTSRWTTGLGEDQTVP